MDFYYEQVHTVTNLLRSKSWSLNKIATIVHTTKGALSKVYTRPRAKDEKLSAVIVDR
jgi:transcriptional regulator